MTDAQVTAVFALLAVCLARGGMARTPGGAQTFSVDPGEFMYMATAKGHHQFKHRVSRNYVFVKVDGSGMVVPCTDRPFMQGEFPAA